MTIKSQKKLPKWNIRRPNLSDNPADIFLYIFLYIATITIMFAYHVSGWYFTLPLIIASLIINIFDDSSNNEKSIPGFIAALGVNILFSILAFFAFFMTYTITKTEKISYKVVHAINTKDFTQTDKFQYSITEKQDGKPIVLSIDAEEFLKLKSCNPAVILKTTTETHKFISKSYDDNKSKIIIDCDNGYPHE